MSAYVPPELYPKEDCLLTANGAQPLPLPRSVSDHARAPVDGAANHTSTSHTSHTNPSQSQSQSHAHPHHSNHSNHTDWREWWSASVNAESLNKCSPALDAWCSGVILHLMLSGSLPFHSAGPELLAHLRNPQLSVCSILEYIISGFLNYIRVLFLLIG